MFTIEFIDNGIGIEPDELEKVFQPFYRAQNAKNISGSGLGLPLTKKIMEIHGGQLDIVSKINSGTTVKMTIKISN